MANYRLNEEKMFSDITDGIAIIINSETGIYYGMNAFGTQVYENLINGVSTEKIWEEIRALGAEEDNFKAFIDAMIEKELIVTSDNTNAEPDINKNIAKEDNFILELKEYNDAQELLLADPIHEVREEEGWSPEKSSLNKDEEDVARREAKME